MTGSEILPPAILQRKAVVYVRQSTQTQVEANAEGRRRQYELVDVARRRGFQTVEDWDVLIRDHHDGYIDWSEYQRNQVLLAANTYGQVGGQKSGRGGRALLSGLLTCGRCGRRLAVA